MTPTTIQTSSSRPIHTRNATIDLSGSGVSWAAIFAGAAAAAALSLILTLLGFGLGLSALSPWSNSGADAQTVGISAAIWLAIVQILAAGLGGYLAGRLRTRWTGLHTDEVYFRDTAHGMLSWAVATLVTAAFLGSAMTGMLQSGAKAVGSVASGITETAGQVVASQTEEPGGSSSSGIMSYYVDSLFRSDQPSGETPADATGEASTILLNALRTGDLPEDDASYLARLVAQRTGLSEADARERVTAAFSSARETMQTMQNQAKEAVDAARKGAATSALWAFVALLCGAFFSSLLAIYGGRRRDSSDLDTSA